MAKNNTHCIALNFLPTFIIAKKWLHVWGGVLYFLKILILNEFQKYNLHTNFTLKNMMIIWEAHHHYLDQKYWKWKCKILSRLYLIFEIYFWLISSTFEKYFFDLRPCLTYFWVGWWWTFHLILFPYTLFLNTLTLSKEF